MESEYVNQLETILEQITTGIAIIAAKSLRIRYVNPYLHARLGPIWHDQEVNGLHLEELLPARIRDTVLTYLHEVALTGQRFDFDELPFEGFLETRGRTYWKVTLQRYNAPAHTSEQDPEEALLLVTLEDVTESVRARLHLHAIHSISSVIASPTSLHLVLDRILQVLQEMFGSNRCAILLLDHLDAESANPYQTADMTQHQTTLEQTSGPNIAQIVTMVAHKGLHASSHGWTSNVTEQLLINRVLHEQQTIQITDTSTIPEIKLPDLEYHQEPYRPGSALSVPIYEPRTTTPDTTTYVQDMSPSTGSQPLTILGTIEVYHRRSRSFPAEEVQLLEQFALQAGLALHNARLFHGINRWARMASRQARQKENMMQSIPDGVIICDPHWRITDINQSARQLMDWSEDVLGLALQQALIQSKATFPGAFTSSPDLATYLEQRATTNQVDEFKIVGANQKEYSVQCTYTPIFDDNSDVFAFLIIFHDVTDQVAARERIEAEVISRTAELKQRNEALQQAQMAQMMESARMKLLLERLPTGVIHVSASNTKITVINRQAVELLQHIEAPLNIAENENITQEQLIHQSCEDFLRYVTMYNLANNIVPYEEQPLYNALMHGYSSEAELHTRKTDGQIVYLLVNAAPLRAPSGQIMSAILVLQEITRIKALERSREDFFTTMAHELKTPLANIRAHLSALLAKDLEWSSEEQYDFLRTADGQVDRLVGMINHFLDASRVEAGALRLALEPILIPELCEDLEDRLEALIQSSQRRLNIVLPEHLPAVQGDYELIISVLSNLLSNAFRYTPAGDAVQLQAELIGSQEDIQNQSVRFSVIDHGPGISEEQQIMLFTRFSTFAELNRPSIDSPGQPEIARQQKTSRWSPATGLGLYISRGIIEAHKSHLTVKSSPGQGATFAFTLPVYQGKQ
ncbi:MAG TPA: PAS domain-containing protein [Dictyobacter sp.]|jgi:signal transduction histidine kinase/GAF domain-containing protein|nr:PAS domain-containing protein [Dictyobacter sp.]